MRIRIVVALIFSLAVVASPLGAQGTGSEASGVSTWRIDTTHSELSFRVRHLVSRVRGTFGEWNGTLVADPDRLGDGTVEVTIQTASIDTRHQRRDNHLRSDDFFDVQSHPTISFRSQRVAHQGERISVHGMLTMRGVTRPVILEGQFLGLGLDGQGRRRLGFEASTTLNRHDFGVSWNNVVEGGGLVLGDEVTIQMVIAAVEQ